MTGFRYVVVNTVRGGDNKYNNNNNNNNNKDPEQATRCASS
jgi:hypothetical protein